MNTKNQIQQRVIFYGFLLLITFNQNKMQEIYMTISEIL